MTHAGINLYTYCKSDPVNNYDPSGHFLISALIIASTLLFTPIGDTVLQILPSTISYVGIAITAIFDEDIRNDMNSIGWNPFNINEENTLKSSKVSFYKGVPVFKTSNNRSGSFGTIFLSNGSNVDTLRHERGHNLQLMMMGIGTYGFTVELPSVFILEHYGYYDAPWKTLADILGGVKTQTHTSEEMSRAWLYYGLGNLLLPSIFYWL